MALLILGMFPFPGFSQNSNTAYVISSGSKGGAYYQTASQLEAYVHQKMDEVSLTVIPSKGSIENLERLESGLADLILTQRDAAVHTYYHGQPPFKNMEIVMPLFPEFLQLFVAGKSGKVSFSELAAMIQKGEITRIGVGPDNSTTNQTVRSAFLLLGYEQPDSLFDTRSPNEYIPDFLNGTVGAAAIFAAAPWPLIPNQADKQIGMVSFSNHEIENLISRMSDLDPIEIPGSSYEFLPPGEAISSIGTWALLLAREGFSELFWKEHNTSLQEAILQGINQDPNPSFLQKTYTGSGTFPYNPETFNIAIDREDLNPNLFFRGLPIGSGFRGFVEKKTYWWVIGVILLLGLIYVGYHYRKEIDYYKQWVLYRHLLFGLIFLIGAYFLLAELIAYFENELFLQHHIRSPILELSGRDLHGWLLLLMFLSYDGGIFPISTEAQAFVALAVYLNIATTVFVLIYHFILHQSRKKKRMGKADISSKNHLVICGWNTSGKVFIENLFKALKEFNNERHPKVVIIHPGMESIIQEDDELKRMLEAEGLRHIDGDPRDEKFLRQANISKAKTVVLLSEDESRESDERTLLRALSISRYVRREAEESENKKKGKEDEASENQSGATVSVEDQIYMIAEVTHVEFKDALRSADVNEVVCTSEMGNSVMIQSTINHGVSEVLDEVLTYHEENNEFYIIDLRDVGILRDKTFDELLVPLRKRKILLLGIKAAFYDHDFDDNGKKIELKKKDIPPKEEQREIIDKKRLKRILENEKLRRQIMINPTTIEEKEYPADENDQLIVFAESGEVINQAIRYWQWFGLEDHPKKKLDEMENVQEKGKRKEVAVVVS